VRTSSYFLSGDASTHTYTYAHALTRLRLRPLHKNRTYMVTLHCLPSTPKLYSSDYLYQLCTLTYQHKIQLQQTMCTSYKIRYFPCKRKGYDLCVTADFQQCKKAEESRESCTAPTTRTLWIDYKCPQHGGPTPQEREKLMKERGLHGSDRQIAIRKGDRPSKWKGALCVVM
jgi:hypothetical protein